VKVGDYEQNVLKQGKSKNHTRFLKRLPNPGNSALEFYLVACLGEEGLALPGAPFLALTTITSDESEDWSERLTLAYKMHQNTAKYTLNLEHFPHVVHPDPSHSRLP